MKILFSESKNVVDKIIGWMTGEDCGHMALLFESRAGTGVVFESNLLGCHPSFFRTWMGGSREIIHFKHIETSPEEENQIWDAWVEKFDGHQYDFGGAIYLGFCKLRQRLFGTPLPKKNKWAKRQAFFCDEIYALVSGLPDCPIIDFDSNGMDSPHDVWLKIK